MKFASSGKHEYAKLVPEAVGDLEALAEGEGKCIGFMMFTEDDSNATCLRGSCKLSTDSGDGNVCLQN